MTEPKTPETDEQRAKRYAETEASYPTLAEDVYRKRTRRSLLTGGLAALAGFGAWRWVQGQSEDNGIPQVLRDVHEKNESLWRTLYRGDALAPTFDRSESSVLRVNGRRGGLSNEIDLAAWSMTVLGQDGAEIGTHVLTDITALPNVEMTVEHKCVEGWSHVVTWGGVRFSDFVAALYPDQMNDPPDYVSLVTPDGGFYVGLEWAAMMHPQTLLCSELEGEPLSQDHGAPLRLVTPLKYGTKQLKRIALIEFTNTRPADFWAERGYDWYAAL